jgi:hypothetical protein
VIEVRVAVLTGALAGTGRCLIDGTTAEVHLPDTGGRPERIPSALVPVRLARMVELGPRPVIEAPGILIAGALEIDRLLGLDGAARTRGGAPAWTDPLPAPSGGVPVTWRDPLARIVAARRAWWWVTVAAAKHGDAQVDRDAQVGAAPDRVGGNGQVDRLEVVDAGEAGLWVRQQHLEADLARELEDGPGEGPATALTATTPTAVWAWLSRHVATCT